MYTICFGFVNGFITEQRAREMLAELFKLSQQEIDHKIAWWKMSTKYL